MRTAKASKREIAFVVVLVAVAAIGAVVYWGTIQVQNARYRQEIEKATVVVEPGEVHSISASLSPWDGTMEIALTRSAWYESFSKADEAENLGDVSSYAEESDGGYVVCELLLHSVDAVPMFYEENQLNVSVFRLLAADGETYIIPESVWSSVPKVKDENSSIYTLEFSRGDTATVRLGFPLAAGEPLDELAITFASSLTRFALNLAS